MQQLKRLITLFLVTIPWASPTFADWQMIEQKARGQTVYFNAWGGGESINQYIRWVSDQVDAQYDITLKHVKITDAATVVSRILAEKSSGRLSQGSVDLIWINGENFRTMKMSELLYGPFPNTLPNTAFLNGDSGVFEFDFGTAVDGLESPWGFAQLTFYYDNDRLDRAPKNMAELADFARAHPGRFSYPSPPDFYGTTFIKQALIETISDPIRLAQPVSEAEFTLLAKPLWHYLDELHPHMWRKGQQFPSSAGQIKQLLNDGELIIGFTFNPNEPAAGVLQGELPESTRTYIHQNGTIGNTHFVAIPFNSGAKEAAMVVANYLLSPEAQARKAELSVWGDPSVLDMNKLSPAQRKAFVGRSHPTLLPEASQGKLLPEPHASWTELLEREWRSRYLP
jgi:putative thiamine transport system substrate-binding protein